LKRLLGKLRVATEHFRLMGLLGMDSLKKGEGFEDGEDAPLALFDIFGVIENFSHSEVIVNIYIYIYIYI
jgi:hypothetical protein